MRRNIAAANWKMNLDNLSAKELVLGLLKADLNANASVILATPFVYLQNALSACIDNNQIDIAAQNIHHQKSGAFTGEISGEMLNSIGVKNVLIGHSERREYQNENGEIIRQKIDRALENDINVIYCCGEALDIRKEGNHVQHVINQIETELISYLKEGVANFVIAYEPIWAIGTGETASPAQAQEMHKAIRDYLRSAIGENAGNISILYGGSVKPANAQELFGQPDVDGGLVGGASLKADSFVPIINAF